MLPKGNDRVKINVGHLPILDHLILGAAEKNEGEFLETLTLKSQQFKNWDAIAAALENNEINGAFLMFPLALDLYRKHHDTTLVLLGHREGQVLVTDAHTNTIAELKGKTIHIPHVYSTHHLLLAEIMKHAGLDVQKDIKLKIGYENIRDAVDLLEQGSSSGFIIAEPLGTEARRRKVGHIITLSHDVAAHHIDCVLVLKNTLIKNNPEACQELIESLVKAGMFINAYPRQAAEIGQQFLGWSKKVLLEALTHDKGHILFWDLLPRIEDFETLQHIAVDDLHLWENKIDLQPFINPTFAQEAYRNWMIDTRRERGDKGVARTVPGSCEEALAQLQAALDTTVPAITIRYIASGEKFPKNIAHVATYDDETIKNAFAGNEYIIRDPASSVKGIAIGNNKSNFVPQRIVLKLDKQNAEKCAQALQFGATKNNFLQCATMVELLESTSPIATHETNEATYYALSYEVFKLLPLLISLFA